ncbi:MAG: hypothetical protein HY319_04420 [Armatimonadetes bacterium]|nr:hypothetical protein [Armatimonadota bacterium]
MKRRSLDLIVILAVIAVGFYLARSSSPQAEAPSPVEHHLTVRGVRPGMSVVAAERLLGSSRGDSFNERAQGYRNYGDVALLPRGDVVDCLYAPSVEVEGAQPLRVGQTRSEIEKLLGEPRDPGNCSPHRAPEYALYYDQENRLEIRYDGDRVAQLCLFVKRQP